MTDLDLGCDFDDGVGYGFEFINNRYTLLKDIMLQIVSLEVFQLRSNLTIWGY